MQAQLSGRNTKTGFVYALDYAREHGSFVGDDRLAYKSEDFLDVHQHNYEAYAGYRDVGPNYAPVLGFTLDPDIRGPQAFFDLNGTLSPHGPVKRADLFVTADRYLDRSGAAHQADFNLSLDLQFKIGLHLSGGPYCSFLRTYDSGLVGYPFYSGGVTRTYNQHYVNLGWKEGTPAPYTASFSWGPFGDLVPAAGVARDLARDGHALEHRRRDRRHARAAVASAARPTASGCAASRSARRSTPTPTSRSRCAGSAVPAASPSRGSTWPARCTAASRTTASCSSTTAPPPRRPPCSGWCSSTCCAPAAAREPSSPLHERGRLQRRLAVVEALQVGRAQGHVRR